MDWIGLDCRKERDIVGGRKTAATVSAVYHQNCYDLRKIERKQFNICHLEMRMTFCYRPTIHWIWRLTADQTLVCRTVYVCVGRHYAHRKFGTFLMWICESERASERIPRLGRSLTMEPYHIVPYRNGLWIYPKFKTRSTNLINFSQSAGWAELSWAVSMEKGAFLVWYLP